MSIVWQGQGAKVKEAQRIHGTRNAGKLAQGARSNGCRWATCLFGFWGPVPWLNLQAKRQQRQTTQGTGVPVPGCLSLARSSGPHPLAVALVWQGGGGRPAQDQGHAPGKGMRHTWRGYDTRHTSGPIPAGHTSIHTFSMVRPCAPPLDGMVQARAI